MNGWHRLARVFRLELRSELLKLLRMPAFVLPALGFPWLFYLMFGLVLPTGRAGGVSMASYLVATYGVFGVLGASLFSLGAGVAVERGQGWMLARRAMPMPVLVHFAARLVVAMLFALVIVLGLAALGAAVGGVRLPTASWAALIFGLTALAVPFGACGLALGHLLGPNSAPAVINLIYLPLSFLSGLWLPVQILPRILQEAAVALPPYHAAQLALRVFGAARESQAWGSIAYLTVFTAAALAVAHFGWRRDSDRLWG